MTDNTVETVEMKERTKAYLSGLIDAEGCLDIEKHYQTKFPHNDCFYPTISVSNTNRKVIEFIAKRFGGSCSFGGYTSSGSPLFRWRTQGKKHLSKILSYICPYLTIKRREYDILNEFISLDNTHNSETRRELYDRIKWVHHDRSVETDTSKFKSWKPNLIHAYHAGLLDGENTISIGCYLNNKGNPNFKKIIIFTNTFKPVVYQFLYYGGYVNEVPAKENRLKIYHWRLHKKEDQEKFLLKMLPYLIVKREPVKIFLEYLRIDGDDPARRQELMNKIKVFQMKGPRLNKIQSELASDRKSTSAGMPKVFNTI